MIKPGKQVYCITFVLMAIAIAGSAWLPIPPVPSTATPRSEPAGVLTAISTLPALPYGGVEGDDAASFDQDTSAAFDQGIDGLVSGRRLQGDNRPTLQEAYPIGSYELKTDVGTLNWGGNILGIASGVILMLSLTFTAFMITVFQAVFSFDVSQLLGGNAFRELEVSVIEALRDSVYFWLFTLVLALSIAALVWQWMARKQLIGVWSGFVYIVATIVVTMYFFTSYSLVLDHSNKLSSALPNLLLTGMTEADNPPSGNVAPDNAGTVQPTFNGDPATTQLRILSDRLWRPFAYQLWQIVQFGSFEGGEKYGQRWLQAKTVSSDEREAMVDEFMHFKGSAQDPNRPDPQPGATGERKRQQRAQLEAEMDADPLVNNWYKGHQSLERISIVFFGGLMVLANQLVFFGFLLASVVMDGGFHILFMFAPVFLLAALHPKGRGIAERYAWVLAALLVGKFLLQLVLIVLTIVSTTLIGDGTSASRWFFGLFVTLCIYVSLYIFRRPIGYILMGNKAAHRPDVRGQDSLLSQLSTALKTAGVAASAAAATPRLVAAAAAGRGTEDPAAPDTSGSAPHPGRGGSGRTGVPRASLNDPLALDPPSSDRPALNGPRLDDGIPRPQQRQTAVPRPSNGRAPSNGHTPIHRSPLDET
ncbi:hypothetical protein KY386_03020 [Candidatus Parcubacteria bacterium]|nr:hypothetical protein [Candidatus Parcubacteria bacterium]